MKEKIHNIPINDAMANAGECPFCFIEKKVEDDTLDYVLGSGSSYMEYDTREMTDKAGFCRAHFKKMFDYGNTLGNAWILSTHYDQILREMNNRFKNFKPGKGKPALPFGKKKEDSSNTVVDWINDRNRSCFICKNVEESFNDYVEVFFDMYKKDTEFRNNTNVLKKNKFAIADYINEIVNDDTKKYSSKIKKILFNFINDLKK